MRSAWAGRRLLYGVLLVATALYLWHQRAGSEEATSIKRLEEELAVLKRSHAQRLLQEYTDVAAGDSEQVQLFLPSMVDIFPHLMDLRDLKSLNPAFRLPDRKLSNVDVVMGIPAVERGNATYLIKTLNMLISRARPQDMGRIRFVVMLSHEEGTESAFVKKTSLQLQDEFKRYIDSGIVQIIVPPKSWFPRDLHEIIPTFGDTEKRMYWRTKQNLDYAYLMMYAARQGTFYMQLEDDIETIEGYTGQIMNIVDDETHKFFLVDFSTLGFIGKLMRSQDTITFTVHILLNYRYKPIDWLLSDFINNRLCSPEMNSKKCLRANREQRKAVKPSVFQHIGLFSSLPGKIQKLKDKAFRKSNARIEDTKMVTNTKAGNPGAKVSTSMTSYLSYSVSGAYSGHTMAWLIDPTKDDYIAFTFEKPVAISSVKVETGTDEHESDLFGPETKVVATFQGVEQPEAIGTFEVTGELFSSVVRTEPVTELRIVVQEPIRHWVIIRSITVTPK